MITLDKAKAILNNNLDAVANTIRGDYDMTLDEMLEALKAIRDLKYDVSEYTKFSEAIELIESGEFEAYGYCGECVEEFMADILRYKSE